MKLVSVHTKFYGDAMVSPTQPATATLTQGVPCTQGGYVCAVVYWLGKYIR